MKDHPSIFEYRWQNKQYQVSEAGGVGAVVAVVAVVVAVELVVRLLE